ncbi:hypothetical protein Dimus_021696, partial [Dionaea muscipula]
GQWRLAKAEGEMGNSTYKSILRTCATGDQARRMSGAMTGHASMHDCGGVYK